MWELRTKDQYGQIAQIHKENPLTATPVYDSITPKNRSGYNDAKLTVGYSVEWLPEENSAAYENSQKSTDGPEPWELMNEYQTDSLGLAIRQLLLRTLDPHADMARLFMWITTEDGHHGAEATTEIPGDTVPILRNMVQENINKRIDSLEKAVDALEKELAVYKSFIKKYNSEKLFDDFRREINNNE
jgi:hypothetical protein